MRATLKGNEIVTKVRSCSFGGGTKGNCFSISVPSSVIEEKANCFSLSTYDKPCFSIKCEEEYDEVTVSPPGTIDMSEFGVTKIFGVQATSVNTLWMVAAADLGSGEKNYLLDVTYLKSPGEGIQSVTSIFRALDITEYITVETAETFFQYIQCYSSVYSGSTIAIGESSTNRVFIFDATFWEYSTTLSLNLAHIYGGFIGDGMFVEGIGYGVYTNSTTSCQDTELQDAKKYLKYWDSEGVQHNSIMAATNYYPTDEFRYNYIQHSSKMGNDKFITVASNSLGNVAININAIDTEYRYGTRCYFGSKGDTWIVLASNIYPRNIVVTSKYISFMSHISGNTYYINLENLLSGGYGDSAISRIFSGGRNHHTTMGDFAIYGKNTEFIYQEAIESALL